MDQLRSFTIDELKEFNGIDGKPLYVSIGGKVFDCTPGMSFYGPGGPYEMFAGRDISLAAAKFSKEDIYLQNPSLVDITESEKESFFTFYNMLYGKYNLIGILTGVDYSKQLEQMKQKQVNLMNKLASKGVKGE
jgi:membrane-associated progesterone receptor component